MLPSCRLPSTEERFSRMRKWHTASRRTTVVTESSVLTECRVEKIFLKVLELSYIQKAQYHSSDVHILNSNDRWKSCHMRRCAEWMSWYGTSKFGCFFWIFENWDIHISHVQAQYVVKPPYYVIRMSLLKKPNTDVFSRKSCFAWWVKEEFSCKNELIGVRK